MKLAKWNLLQRISCLETEFQSVFPTQHGYNNVCEKLKCLPTQIKYFPIGDNKSLLVHSICVKMGSYGKNFSYILGFLGVERGGGGVPMIGH